MSKKIFKKAVLSIFAVMLGGLSAFYVMNVTYRIVPNDVFQSLFQIYGLYLFYSMTFFSQIWAQALIWKFDKLLKASFVLFLPLVISALSIVFTIYHASQMT